MSFDKENLKLFKTIFERSTKETSLFTSDNEKQIVQNAWKALLESEERFRILTSHAPVGIFFTDKEGNCLFVNEKWCQLAGMKKEEAMGMGWIKALHPEDKDLVSKKWYEAAKTGKEFVLQYRFITAKGKITWLSGSAVSIKDDKNRTTGYIGTIADITAQKIAQASLEVSEERLRLALEAGKIGVWDWDLEKSILTWTENVYDIHGVNKANFKVTLDNFQKLIHPDDKKRVLSQIDKGLTGKEEFNTEFRIITPKGDVRWVATRATVAFNKKNQPIRMLGATSDVTHRKQIEQEKSDFIGMASHELKTPITSMKLFADALLHELEKSSLEKPLRYAQRIREQTNRLVALTNDLLDVSRIETGKLRLKKEKVNLTDLISDTLEGLKSSSQHQILLEIEKEIFVEADKYRLYQVLVNLLTNAIKYSPEGKKIVISLHKKDDQAVVSIKDYGIGIAKEKQTKIFDRLYQVTDSKLKTFPGLGLGLYITKEIMERHNGKLWLKSEQGKGSTFYFSLALSS